MTRPGVGDFARPTGEVAHGNAQRLLELIEHDPRSQVERGELLRQLGRFDDAVAVLKAVKPDGYSEVKAVKIEGLASAGIAELRMLNAPTALSALGVEDAVVQNTRTSVW